MLFHSLMSPGMFYNVEKGHNKEKPMNKLMCPLLTGTVFQCYRPWFAPNIFLYRNLLLKDTTAFYICFYPTWILWTIKSVFHFVHFHLPISLFPTGFSMLMMLQTDLTLLTTVMWPPQYNISLRWSSNYKCLRHKYIFTPKLPMEDEPWFICILTLIFRKEFWQHVNPCQSV